MTAPAVALTVINTTEATADAIETIASQAALVPPTTADVDVGADVATIVPPTIPDLDAVERTGSVSAPALEDIASADSDGHEPLPPTPSSEGQTVPAVTVSPTPALQRSPKRKSQVFQPDPNLQLGKDSITFLNIC